MRQLQIQTLERNRYDQKELRSILSGLQSDRYSKPRTEQLISQAEKYESEHGGSRANKLVLEASKLYLINLTLSK